MVSSWIYLTSGVIVALIALGAVAINTALEQIHKLPMLKSLPIDIDTKTRYVGESNNTILNSTQQSIDGQDVMITEVIIEPQGSIGGNWGGWNP